ncbi:MAG: hypothetical protein ACJ74T_01985 [Pyrinomonadaceae bacterium]
MKRVGGPERSGPPIFCAQIAHRCPVHRTLTNEIAVTEMSNDPR